MHATDLGDAFKMIMAERGWTQTDLGRELGRDQTWVSRAVAGHRDLRTREASKFLAKVGWELHITPKSDGGLAEDDPVKRREFVAGASALFISSPKTTPFHDPRYVEELTRRLTLTVRDVGGNSQAPRLINHARKIRSASIDGGSALQSAASDFMRYGSFILRQAGQNDISIQFANSALRHAKQAADPDKQASAYFALCLASVFNGNARHMSTANGNGGRAVMLAQEGLRTPGISDVSRAYLNACLACGLANVPGQERQAYGIIDKILNIDTLPAVDRADVIGMAGNAFRDTRARHEAIEMLGDAARQSASYSQMQQAHYLCDQIMIILEIREPLLAAPLIDELSCLIPLTDSMMFDRQVVQLLRLAQPWVSVSEIRAACQRLQSARMASEGSQ